MTATYEGHYFLLSACLPTRQGECEKCVTVSGAASLADSFSNRSGTVAVYKSNHGVVSGNNRVANV